MSTPRLKNALITIVREMGVRPLPKNPKLAELADWVMHELPAIAPDDPRTAQAVELAREWWEHERSGK
jgi:hypothetical protein